MNFFEEIIPILLGGAIGSLMRFLISRYVNELMPKNYPWGIWLVNILGCFIMGIFAALFLHKYLESTWLRAGVVIGFLGGFTTFSSFSLDALTLVQNGQVTTAFIYVLTSVLLCLGAVYLGFILISHR